MNLKALGWNAFFSGHWQKTNEKTWYPARVCRQDRKEYTLLSRLGIQKARSRGVLHSSPQKESPTPVVGDWVAASQDSSGENSIIHTVLPRRSMLSRKVPGSKTEQQVLAANIDYLFIVTGLDTSLNIRRLERFLTQGWGTGAVPVIVLNKRDLSSNPRHAASAAAAVAGGCAVHTVSALQRNGLDPLLPYLHTGKTVSLLGPSGAGKSTIVNTLLGEDYMKVQSTHTATGEGRHTTSHRELIVLPKGGLLIDMPGVRELQLWANEKQIKQVFSDIEQLSETCRFRDCRHETEPGCAVMKAVSGGRLQQERLSSYRKLMQELIELEDRKERKKWKSSR